MDCIKFYRPPLGSSRALSRFPACRDAAIAPQCNPRSGITPGGKQRGPTVATNVPLPQIGHSKDTTSASCGAIRSNDNRIEHDNNHQRTEEPLPVIHKNGLGASPQSQTDDDVGPTVKPAITRTTGLQVLKVGNRPRVRRVGLVTCSVQISLTIP